MGGITYGFVVDGSGVTVTIPSLEGLTWVVVILAALAVGLLARFLIKLVT